MKLPDLKEIAATKHNDNPYHNWLHGEYVGDTMAILEDTRELTPGIVGWYFHDADHNWVADSPNDEERAARIMHDSLIDRGFDRNFISSAQTSIMGTVFSERWNLTLPEQKLIADADISSIWWKYDYYLRCAAKLFLETTKEFDISDDIILNFFWDTQQSFFKFLTWITWKDNNPFLTQKAQRLFPNFIENRDKIQEEVETNKTKLIWIVREIEKSPEISKFRERFDS